MSVFHGVLPAMLEGSVPVVPTPIHAVLGSSPKSSEWYARRFGIPRDRIHATGLIRHAREWMAYVVERSTAIHEVPFREFTFVVSPAPAEQV